MTSLILKYVTNRILKDNQWNRLGVEDPYHEYLEIPNSLKKKKIPRRIPQGISSHDETVLQSFRKRANRYDMWFSIFGIKFGWSNIVGLVPIAGTFISTYWSLGLLMLARKAEDGFPLDLQLIFLLNIAIDFLLGLIPIVGDLIEIGYKCNLRNYLLFEKHMDRIGQKNMGIISEDEVRPGYINDTLQPFVDEKVKPHAIKAGEQFKTFVEKRTSKKSQAIQSEKTSADSSFRHNSADSNTTLATTADVEGEILNNGPIELSDLNSNSEIPVGHGTPDRNNPLSRDDVLLANSVKSLNSLLGKDKHARTE